MWRNVTRLGLMLVALALVMGMAVARTPRAGAAGAPLRAAEEQCFTETDQCVGPLFLAYWQAHGGLAINGFPLSAERVELLDDGRPYTVQYFERVRMEYHPENAVPFNVLLGQFGREIHPADPPVSPSSGPLPADRVYFKETGHYIIGAFFNYWYVQGGLAQFGYPLTEEIDETLTNAQGQPQSFKVQYFERARFEWHPENTDPQYQVLLGQFGRTILDQRDERVVAATCAAADLRADVVMMGAAGSREGAVQLINLSGEPCTLRGSPEVALTDEGGTPLDVTVTEGPAQDGVGIVGVGRGQAIKVPVRWSNYCGPQSDTAVLQLTLPDGGVVRATGASVPPCLGETQPSTFNYLPFTVGGQEQAAANVVLGFYGAINAQDYQAAYAMLGAELQASQSYDDFAAGYDGTANVLVSRIEIGGSATSNVYAIGVTLYAEQTDLSVKIFNGVYDVGLEDGVFKIIGANVTAQQ